LYLALFDISLSKRGFKKITSYIFELICSVKISLAGTDFLWIKICGTSACLKILQFELILDILAETSRLKSVTFNILSLLIVRQI